MANINAKSGPTRLERTISFSGPIYQYATKLLRNMCCAAVNDNVTHLTILFTSDGGSIDDGFSLYGFLQALPLELTIHNVGLVGSMANAVFLAGKKRHASPHSIFLFHDLHWRYAEVQNVMNMKINEHSSLLENARLRLKTLFKLHAKTDAAAFNGPSFFKDPMILDATAAKAAGIVHDVKKASIPFGTKAFNSDWTYSS